MSKHPETKVEIIIDDEPSQSGIVSRTISPELLQAREQQPVAEGNTNPAPPAPHGNDDNHNSNNQHPKQTGSIIKVVPKHTSGPALAHRHADQNRADSTATPLAAPPPGARNTMRLRGALMGPLGMFYPDALFHIHRVGDRDPASDVEVQGDVLWALRTVFSPAASPPPPAGAEGCRPCYYRVTMTACPPRRNGPAAAATARETLLGWVDGAGRAGADAADEYARVLELGCCGEGGAAELMMFTVHTPEERGWVVARQIPGKEYSLAECLDVLRVVPECRQEVQEFGPKRWRVGQPVPLVYVCKDMSLSEVRNKIRNIMRD